MTDPYGKLKYCIGTTDDFWCFDFEDHGDGTMTLHAVINSETVNFIQDAETPVRVPFVQAVAEAKRLTGRALDWLAEAGAPLKHDTKGWNQSASYFWRSIHAYVTNTGTAIRIPAKMIKRPLITRNYL